MTHSNVEVSSVGPVCYGLGLDLFRVLVPPTFCVRATMMDGRGLLGPAGEISLILTGNSVYSGCASRDGSTRGSSIRLSY